MIKVPCLYNFYNQRIKQFSFYQHGIEIIRQQKEEDRRVLLFSKMEEWVLYPLFFLYPFKLLIF